MIDCKWKKYQKYKESGIEWLGNVPEKWVVCFLKYNLNLITDGAHVSPIRENAIYHFVSTVDIDKGEIDFERCLKTSNESYKLLKAQGCKPLIDDVLFSKDGTIGKTVVIKEDIEFVVASSLIIMRPKKTALIPEYLDYMLHSSLILEQINSFVKGVALNRLSLFNLKKIIGVFPPINEQREIIDFVNTKTSLIDTLISKKQKLIDHLKEYRTAIINQAVTKGLNPDVPMKDSGIEWLGEVPEHWQVKKLKYVSMLQTGLTLGKNYYGTRKLITRPYLRVANVQDGYLDLLHIKEISVPVEEAKRYELKSGDVLMTEGGDFDKLGRGYIWEGQIKECLHQNHIFAVRPIHTILNSKFLSALMTSLHGKHYFTSNSQQTTNLATTNSTKLKSFPLTLPPVSEQKTIVEFIEDNTSKIDQIIELSSRVV